MDGLDHLVLAVPDLDAACEWFLNLTGIHPVYGGRHLDFGTHNALVGLGERCYLELIATDPAAHITVPRWMAVDSVEQPMLTRWALASTQLSEKAAVLEQYEIGLGELRTGSRTLPSGRVLTWMLSLPKATPLVEVAPFLIDWSNSEAHAADALKTQARLLSLSLKHPQPQKIRGLLRQLAIEVDVTQHNTTKICASIETPRGRVDLC